MTLTTIEELIEKRNVKYKVFTFENITYHGINQFKHTNKMWNVYLSIQDILDTYNGIEFKQIGTLHFNFCTRIRGLRARFLSYSYGNTKETVKKTLYLRKREQVEQAVNQALFERMTSGPTPISDIDIQFLESDDDPI